MKCNQCGTEFEGETCPFCGAKAEKRKGDFYEKPEQDKGTGKNKKPFYKKWWFIVIVILVLAVLIGKVNSFIKNRPEKIVWSDMILGEKLPEPSSNKGEILVNTADELWLDLVKVSDKEANDYVEACREKGFTTEAGTESYSYEAYNEEGYQLTVRHFSGDSEMSIQLNRPEEMGTIAWPSGKAGKALPVPKSMVGKFSYERDDGFSVCVGNTTKEDYDAYVSACSEKGFDVNYDKGEKYYSADHENGSHLSLKYQGNNVMSIEIDVSNVSDGSEDMEDSTEEDTETVAEAEETAEEAEDESEEEESEQEDSGAIRAEFKAAMDSYEAVMDDYIDFMKKYENADPTDVQIIADYADYMKKYAKACEDFEKWEGEDMNAAETAYYIDVQARVSKKLLEVAE